MHHLLQPLTVTLTLATIVLSLHAPTIYYYTTHTLITTIPTILATIWNWKYSIIVLVLLWYIGWLIHEEEAERLEREGTGVGVGGEGKGVWVEEEGGKEVWLWAKEEECKCRVIAQ